MFWYMCGLCGGGDIVELTRMKCDCKGGAFSALILLLHRRIAAGSLGTTFVAFNLNFSGQVDVQDDGVQRIHQMHLSFGRRLACSFSISEL